MKCHACGEEGHMAFFCPYSGHPNLEFEDSGHRAFEQLPANTQRWSFIKSSLHEAYSEIQQLVPDLPEDELYETLARLAGKSFASGWRYCCVKKHFNNPSHKAEPSMLRPNTTATTNTDSASEAPEPEQQEYIEAEPIGELSGEVHEAAAVYIY